MGQIRPSESDQSSQTEDLQISQINSLTPLNTLFWNHIGVAWCHIIVEKSTVSMFSGSSFFKKQFGA